MNSGNKFVLYVSICQIMIRIGFLLIVFTFLTACQGCGRYKKRNEAISIVFSIGRTISSFSILLIKQIYVKIPKRH